MFCMTSSWLNLDVHQVQAKSMLSSILLQLLLLFCFSFHVGEQNKNDLPSSELIEIESWTFCCVFTKTYCRIWNSRFRIFIQHQYSGPRVFVRFCGVCVCVFLNLQPFEIRFVCAADELQCVVMNSKQWISIIINWLVQTFTNVWVRNGKIKKIWIIF